MMLGDNKWSAHELSCYTYSSTEWNLNPTNFVFVFLWDPMGNIEHWVGQDLRILFYTSFCCKSLS